MAEKFLELFSNVWLLPFAVPVAYYLGRHWTKQEAVDRSLWVSGRLDEIEEKGRDIKDWMRQRNAENLAALSGHATVTNGLLGAILAVLIFR